MKQNLITFLKNKQCQFTHDEVTQMISIVSMLEDPSQKPEAEKVDETEDKAEKTVKEEKNAKKG